MCQLGTEEEGGGGGGKGEGEEREEENKRSKFPYYCHNPPNVTGLSPLTLPPTAPLGCKQAIRTGYTTRQ